MQTNLIQIGNSKGIRIPKTIIEQCGLLDNVEIEVKDNNLIISASKPRQSWDQAFKQMAINDDDTLPNQEVISNKWDEEEWQW